MWNPGDERLRYVSQYIDSIKGDYEENSIFMDVIRDIEDIIAGRKAIIAVTKYQLVDKAPPTGPTPRSFSRLNEDERVWVANEDAETGRCSRCGAKLNEDGFCTECCDECGSKFDEDGRCPRCDFTCIRCHRKFDYEMNHRGLCEACTRLHSDVG